MAQSRIVTDSEFNMWRAVFAFAFVDNVLTIAEQRVLRAHMASVPFSQPQTTTLRADLKSPPDVVEVYSKITERAHRKQFCVLARTLVWCEGDMDRQEEVILERVGCLGQGEGRDVLRESRDDANLRSYHSTYKQAGLAGLFKTPPRIHLHA